MTDRFDAPLQKTSSLTEAAKRAFAKAPVFSGRASRVALGLLALLRTLASVVLVAIGALLLVAVARPVHQLPRLVRSDIPGSHRFGPPACAEGAR